MQLAETQTNLNPWLAMMMNKWINKLLKELTSWQSIHHMTQISVPIDYHLNKLK